MTLQQLAKIRMVKGKKDHPDQEWRKMSIAVKVREAKEEIADIWNYVDTHPRRNLIRSLLLILWKLL